MTAKEQSYWTATVPETKYPEAKGDIIADAVVIGGGMAGVTAAWQLKQAGLRVALFESGRIGRGNTGGTTAKITAQHGLIYDTITRENGAERAALYAKANLKALDEYRRIISANGIKCDFRDADSYFYSTTKKGANDNETEALAAIKAGLTADIVESAPELPFGIINAYRVAGQAQFHPLKFLQALAALVDGGGCAVYENTRVKEVRDDMAMHLEHAVCRPSFVVVATHFPFINTPGWYFLKMYQSRSYGVAFKSDKPMTGHYNSAEDDGYSLRTTEDENGVHTIMIGGAHKTGKSAPDTSYCEIVDKAAQKFYGIPGAEYRWSAQDCMTLDHIPYIGKYSRSSRNMFVVTGFEKWGMTGSMAGAMLLRDLIGGRRSRFSPLYNPSRGGTLTSVGVEAELVSTVAVNLTKSVLKLAKTELDEIPPGGAGIINHDDHRVGVYRDGDGKAYAVNTSCSHMGCALSWNKDMKSWDCPCHGSRFDIHGAVLDAPAVNALDTYDVESGD